MRVSILALAATAALLCACGEDAEKAGMSSGAIASELAETKRMRVGQYETDVRFLRFDVPGMPAAALAQMRQQMESATAVKNSYCLTEEEAARSRQDRLKEMGNAQGDCAFQSFDVDGEAVSGTLRCTGMSDGGNATLTMAGTMGTEGSDVRITTAMTSPAMPQANATVDVQITTRRIGDCTPASRAQAEAQAAARKNRAAPAE
jgi:hypothetical protein